MMCTILKYCTFPVLFFFIVLALVPFEYSDILHKKINKCNLKGTFFSNKRKMGMPRKKVDGLMLKN